MEYASSYINIHLHVSVAFATIIRGLYKNTDMLTIVQTS